MVDILFNVGSKNSAAILELSLWQQMKILQGVIQTSLQVNLDYSMYTLSFIDLLPMTENVNFDCVFHIKQYIWSVVLYTSSYQLVHQLKFSGKKNMSFYHKIMLLLEIMSNREGPQIIPGGHRTSLYPCNIHTLVQLLYVHPACKLLKGMVTLY